MTSVNNNIIKNDSPWVEKYRPKIVKNIISQEEVINSLNSIIKNGNLPHLLFHGPSGVGKTTTALALCYQLFGPSYKNRVLELNASDDRGIDVVRKKIKTFATLSVGNSPHGFHCPPFKIIILDEVDNMTQDAQAALRRIMEKYSHITRFILICNYITHIIDPINSRCAKFRFKYMNSIMMHTHLREIAFSEKFKITDDTISCIINISNGDMRHAIMILQTGIILYGSSLYPHHILDISGYINDNIIKKILNECKNKNFDNASNLVIKSLSDGFTANQILLQLSDNLNKINYLSNKNYGIISIAISKIDYKLSCGADQKLQLLEVIGTIIRNS